METQKNIEKDIQKQLLKKLMYNTKLKYNELWDKSIPSSYSNYHLKELIKQGIVEKEGGYYKLSAKGFEYISSIDGQEIKAHKKPLVCAFILCINYKNEKILLHKRKKQPYLGVWCMPGGKNDFLENNRETSKKELFEETGLIGTPKIKIIDETFTYFQEEVIQHIYAHYYVCTDFSGDLIIDNREGTNKWIDISKLNKLNLFPELQTIIPKLLDKEINFLLQETTIYQKNMESNEIISSESIEIKKF